MQLVVILVIYGLAVICPSADKVHQVLQSTSSTVYPKKYAHGFCFAVLCCAYTLTDFPISIRLTSLALWQSNDCPSASKATLMNMDKYFMRIHYERLHNHNKAKHNKTVCIFLGIYCTSDEVCIWSLLCCVFIATHFIEAHMLQDSEVTLQSMGKCATQIQQHWIYRWVSARRT